MYCHTITHIFPSQITRRYAEFSAALVSVNQSHPEEQVNPFPCSHSISLSHSHVSIPSHYLIPMFPFHFTISFPCFHSISFPCFHSDHIQVDKCLSALQGEVENFVLRMAAEFPHRKEQLIFLVNNYDMMLAVLSVSCQQMSM